MTKVASLWILGMIWLWPWGRPIDPPRAGAIPYPAIDRTIPVEASFRNAAVDLGRSGSVTDACFVEEEEEDSSDEPPRSCVPGSLFEGFGRASALAPAHLHPTRVASRSAAPPLHLRC